MFWHQNRKPARHELTVMDSSGDTVLATWDPEIAGEVDAALEKFTALAREGYLLYIPDNGIRSADGEKLTAFDASAPLIVAVSQPVGG